MRRLASGVAAVVATGALAAPAAAATKTITIEARSQVQQAQTVDTGPAGPSPGDLIVFTEQLFDPSGKPLGSDAGQCVTLFDNSTSLCTGTYTLHDGQVMVQLLQPGAQGTYQQAITGGTRRYAGARGTVTVRQSANGDRFTFRIALGT